MLNDKNKKIIKINSDTKFRIVVEDISEFDKSLLKECYIDAGIQLNNILHQNYDLIAKQNYDEFNSRKFIKVANNVIAFVGDRGSGKTSVMTSFAKSLESCSKFSEIEDKQLNSIYTKISKNSYSISSIIEPSLLKNNDSIIEIIVADMFKKFKTYMENNKCFNKNREVIDAFEEVYNDLRILSKDKEKIFNNNDDNLEVLMDLVSAINLKENLSKLIIVFLKYVEKDILVLQLDDLDMSLCSGDKLVEDIRKYLHLPNVIILMAMNINQLNEVVKQKVIKDLHYLISYNEKLDLNKGILNKEINSKVQKYMEKLIPANRRVHLPILKSFDNDINLELDNTPVCELSKYIQENLFKKLKLVILMDEHNYWLIPSNLRGTIDLICILDNMKDIEDIKDTVNLYNLKKNIDKFSTYIIDNYAINNVNEKHETFFRELMSCPLSQINQKVVVYLGNEIICKYKSLELDDNDDKKYINTLISPSVKIKNISIGHVNQVINLYHKYFNSEECKKIIMITRLLYSLRLKTSLLKEDYIQLKKIIAGDIYGGLFRFIQHTPKSEVGIVTFQSSDQELFNMPNEEELLALNNIMYNPNKATQSLDEDNVNDLKFNGLIQLFSVLTPTYQTQIENQNRINSKEYYLTYDYKSLEIIDTAYNFKFFNKKKHSFYYKKFIYKPLNFINYYIYYDEMRNKLIDELYDNNEDSKLLGLNKYSELGILLISLFSNQDILWRLIKNIESRIIKESSQDIYYFLNEPINCITDFIKDNFYNNLEDDGNIMSYFKKIYYITLPINRGSEDTPFLKSNLTKHNDEIYLGYYNPALNVEPKIKFNIEKLLKKLSDIRKYLNEGKNEKKGLSISNWILKANRNLINLCDQNNNIEKYKKTIEKYKENSDKDRIKINKTECNTEERTLAIEKFESHILKLENFLKEELNSL